ncbi:MAG TPA: hypothetical protein VHM89_15460, partial [Acidimicrobiales bacterium]|nr:hypothetical protein [Acidimicrobiales bacterium]
MRPPRRAAAVALALVPLGTVAGHVVGYSLADRSAAFDGSHSHLRPTTWLAAVLALGAVGWVASGRDGHRARVRVGWMAAAQAALFVVMEAVEHLTAGHGITHLLAEPALRWGVGAQVVTGAALVATAMIARASG